MGFTRLTALVLAITFATGCFGYNKSAKRWSYLGDTVLVLGGAGLIATDVLSKSDPCMDTPTMHCRYESPLSGVLVAGVALAAAGLFGMLFNATRPNVKTSR